MISNFFGRINDFASFHQNQILLLLNYCIYVLQIYALLSEIGKM